MNDIKGRNTDAVSLFCEYGGHEGKWGEEEGFSHTTKRSAAPARPARRRGELPGFLLG